ncbi:DNA-processing protein DprA [Dongia soli]|uniref:DNA-processing protein DprA n=1 Tax=Dongia soli TaxID=600628 RepID=A0ABU5EID3_9PROT|nr:DNA-processing protein DprA [Dongia soli]MDY0885607.1 DNA-processing protein DprA [Dongia soli]
MFDLTDNRRPLRDAERLDWLRLARSEGVGPVIFRQLLQRFGTAQHALEALPELSRRGGKQRAIQPFPAERARAEIEAAQAIGIRHLAFCEPDYPLALGAIDNAPPLITIRGRVELLGASKIALVGARNASANGRKIAQDIARDLAAAGVVVVSGLARGIDCAAHLGAFQATAGGTIAVVAGGADVLYPPENQALFDRLSREGLVVAELPPGTVPQAKHFPRRNRIISGLSQAVVVIEAALKSGSLITARFALDQGRDVMAVPGSPLDPRCRGANHLIRQGALLVEEAAQILENLDGLSVLPQDYPSRSVAPLEAPQCVENADQNDTEVARRAILSQLGPSPVGVDELLRQCQCSAPVMGLVLLELDLAGRLERHPGNRVSLIA